MLHLVEVIAVLDEVTPTSPVTVPSVHVTAVLARTAKPAADPSPPDAWAAMGQTPATKAKKTRPRTRALKRVRLNSFLLLSPIWTIQIATAVYMAEAFPRCPSLVRRHNKVSKSPKGSRAATISEWACANLL